MAPERVFSVLRRVVVRASAIKGRFEDAEEVTQATFSLLSKRRKGR
jgi:hypothetical protein